MSVCEGGSVCVMTLQTKEAAYKAETRGNTSHWGGGGGKVSVNSWV